MRTAIAALMSLLLAACASGPPMPPGEALFHDEKFAPPSVRIDGADAMAISPEMRDYLVAARISRFSHNEDRKRRLVEALYSKGELQLEYDAAFTRTAAQAYEARSGNCLALVMMTAAFAKELGLNVRYQLVTGAGEWERAGDLYISVGHVNLALAEPQKPSIGSFVDTNAVIIDFLPSRSVGARGIKVVGENTVVAMFLNNRAVEALTQGAANDAYWWAREAIRTDPGLSIAYTTLGVIYRNHQLPEFAENVFRLVAEREPTNISVLSNRVLALRDLGRNAEASALQKRVDALDPHPPYSYFNQGMVALKRHRLEEAKALFLKEVERAPYQSEFQFWLAVTYAELQDPAHAAEHLKKAMAMSTTNKDRQLYAAKLNLLKAHGLQ
jgi:tetratricopeptide (TPR) repeat protein